MVDFIKRDKDDIFNRPILGFLFKNQKFLFAFRSVLTALFFYAIYLGFAVTTKENTFTSALFWSIFWSLFMVTTLPTFGRIFCGICPHGFLGKYITKFGLKKEMPKWMQNRFIGLFLLVLGWWGVYYIFPGVYRTPFGTAMLFTVMTLLSFVIYFLYKDMSYCKYICPIGTVTRAFSKLSFTKLGTYKSACNDCTTFDCATACPYDLKPFTFDKKNSMGDCTLCMECTTACESVNFKFQKQSASLFKKFKGLKVEIWAYILILASIPIAMAFHHGIGRSKAAKDMIWSKTAKLFEAYLPHSIDSVGLFAYLYAVLFTVLAATIGMFIASKILNKSFKDTFYNLGYSYAPLFIFASLGHALSGFFTRGYERIVEGFAWAFGIKVDVSSLAKRGDDWLMIFSAFKWLAIIWALVILYKRMKLLKVDKIKKIIAFPFAALLIVFYFGVNQYRTYVVDTYGRASGGMSGMHGMRGMGGPKFQTVSKDKAIILQKGEHKDSCSVCGMKLPMFYKTNHVATTNSGEVHQYCSIHCLVDEKDIKKTSLKDIKVVDTKTLKFIDAKSAFYVVGSKKKGTMSMVSKYAFSNNNDAKEFQNKYGGRVVDFKTAQRIAMRDFIKPTVRVKPSDTIFFTNRNPAAKRGGMSGMGHMMMGRDRTKVPTTSLYLATKDIKRAKCVKNVRGKFFVTDINNKEITPKIKKRGGCVKITFEVPSSGYYGVYYLYESKSYVNVAKYEYKRFSHGSDDVFSKEQNRAKSFEKIPLEILRLRNSDEDSFYYRLQVGDDLKFKVLKDGKAIRGARVSLKTQLGWQKTARTNKDGIATFKLIQDYNPEWEKFNKRFREKFIVVAQFKDDKKYKISYMGEYTPKRDFYQSYAYALIISLILLVIMSVGIFVYRYKIQKPFREVTFDE